MVKKPGMYLIALGSNLDSPAGDSTQTVLAAIRYISEAGIVVEAVSRLYATPAFPAGSGPDFVNAAARVTSALAPQAMLDVLHGVERRLGRDRRWRWAPRTVDLDLLAAGEAVLPDEGGWMRWAGMTVEEQLAAAPDELILPHPRMQDRAFVLVPLADVAPDWRHPVTGRTVAEMRAALPAREAELVKPISLANPQECH